MDRFAVEKQALVRKPASQSSGRSIQQADPAIRALDQFVTATEVLRGYRCAIVLEVDPRGSQQRAANASCQSFAVRTLGTFGVRPENFSF